MGHRTVKNFSYERKRRSSGVALFAVLVVVFIFAALHGVKRIHDQTEDGRLSALEARARAISWRAADWAENEDGDTQKKALRRLEFDTRYVLGYTLEYVQDLSRETGDYGQSFNDPHFGRKILIDKDLKTDARAHVLAHELGHTLQPPILRGTAGAEVFAEAVGYLVCARLGFEAFEESANYLAFHKSDLDVIDTYRKDLLWAVEVLAGD